MLTGALVNGKRVSAPGIICEIFQKIPIENGKGEKRPTLPKDSKFMRPPLLIVVPRGNCASNFPIRSNLARKAQDEMRDFPTRANFYKYQGLVKILSRTKRLMRPKFSKFRCFGSYSEKVIRVFLRKVYGFIGKIAK